MKKQSVQKSVSLIGLLITCLSSNIVLAEWNNDSASNGYNPGYGNFPPEDIDQRLSEQLDYGTGQYQTQTQAQDQNQRQNNQWSTPSLNKYSTDEYSTGEYPLSEYARPGTNHSPGTYSQQNYTQQTDLPSNYSDRQANQQPYQQPYKSSPYGTYPTAPQVNNSIKNNRSMDFDNPWSNNNSNFSMPRGSNSSGSDMMPNMMPWGNNNNNTISRNPWDNTGSNNSTNFTAPWHNKSSNFSMPWERKDNSGFNPWGN